MIKCKLTKISSTHQNLRTSVVVGQCEKMPTIGAEFVMTAPPLDPAAAFRLIETTPVKFVVKLHGGKYEFQTDNSHYALETFDDDRDERTR